MADDRARRLARALLARDVSAQAVRVDLFELERLERWKQMRTEDVPVARSRASLQVLRDRIRRLPVTRELPERLRLRSLVALASNIGFPSSERGFRLTLVPSLRRFAKRLLHLLTGCIPVLDPPNDPTFAGVADDCRSPRHDASYGKPPGRR